MINKYVIYTSLCSHESAVHPMTGVEINCYGEDRIF